MFAASGHALVLALFAGQATTPAPGVRSERAADTVVWRSGADGYHTYRIPAIVAAKSGDLLAFCEGRKGGQADSGDIDLLLKRSRDGGQTWGAAQVVRDDGLNVCGNPCPVLDARTGRLHIFSTHNLGHDTESEIIDGKAEGSRSVWVMTSDDDGATWSAPREITASTKRAGWTWYATGPGIGVQLTRGAHAGRLVIPCDHIEAGTKRYFSHVVLSDDGGATWRIGGAPPRDQLNECQVAELADGTLVLNMRNYDRAKRTRAISRSSDGGETFGEVVWDDALVEPICQAGLVALDVPSTGSHDSHANDAEALARRLCFSNPASDSQRERMTLKASDDGGATWREVDVLHPGPAAYSCLVPLPPKAGVPEVGCLYECGEADAYERITFSVRAVPAASALPAPPR